MSDRTVMAGQRAVIRFEYVLEARIWGRLVSLAEKAGMTSQDILRSILDEGIDSRVANDKSLRPQGHEDGETGRPGHRLEVLDREIKAVRRERYQATRARRTR